MEAPVVAGVAFNRDEAQITVSGLPDQPGTAYAILKPVADADIEVDMIVLATKADPAVPICHSPCTVMITHRFFDSCWCAARAHSGCFVVGNDRVAKLSIVGVGMRSHAGVAAQLFWHARECRRADASQCRRQRSVSPC